MPTNCKQCFITQYQPHSHPSTKSLGLCSSVLSAAEPISRYVVGARQPNSFGTHLGDLRSKSLSYRCGAQFRLSHDKVRTAYSIATKLCNVSYACHAFPPNWILEELCQKHIFSEFSRKFQICFWLARAPDNHTLRDWFCGRQCTATQS